MTFHAFIAIILAQVFLPPITCRFYPGRIWFGENEFPELSGRMTVRDATLRCEKEPECAGFTYLGSSELTAVRQIAFFRDIGVDSWKDIDWNSYHTERKFSLYKDQIPKVGAYREIPFEYWKPNIKTDAFVKRHNITAIAKHRSGKLRLYHDIDLSTMTRDPYWNTSLNLFANPGTILGLMKRQSIDYCCPKVDIFRKNLSGITPRGRIDRVPCNMSKTDFEELYVRTMTPVIIYGCDYKWLFKNYDLSVESVAKMFHDNMTTPNFDTSQTSRPGFTHIRTPNSFMDEDNDVLQALEEGYLRIFNRLRRNLNCEARKSACSIFSKFQQPSPIPEDLYPKIGYENDLGWVIVSQEGTGSHPHNDPDLTGAWNYLINGYKYWVIFPRGLEAKYINCDLNCSPNLDTPAETYRWFEHVLPQLRKTSIYGKLPLEFIQKPGEAIYLPHGLAHSVLNLRDNVAITENYLFKDALPELMTKIALDEISLFRPNWEERAFKKLYYNLLPKRDRQAMRSMYKQALRRINQEPEFCREAAIARQEKYDLIISL